MTKDNLLTVLDFVGDGSFILFTGLVLAITEGYQRAEQRDWELRNVYKEGIPAGLEVPRNLIPPRWRLPMNRAATIAAALAALCVVTGMIIK